MDQRASLNRIKELYERGENIISYLKSINQSGTTSAEEIMISYDFQAGEYIKKYYKNPAQYKKTAEKIARYLTGLNCRISSLFEAGVGEARMLTLVLNAYNKHIDWVGGVDLSWSRIKAGQEFLKKELTVDINPELLVGDMFNLPLKNDSIDVVYTMHSMEPNGGKEKELLEELYRVTRKYLVLIEPSYELANDEGKARMDKHGYVKYLGKHSKELGYKIIKKEPFESDSNSLNPAEVIIIEKKRGGSQFGENPLCDPVTKASIDRYEGYWYCKQSMLSYPIINGVSCFNKDNSIVTTKMSDYV